MKTNQEIGTLFVRVILGLIFFLHGLQAYQGGLEEQRHSLDKSVYRNLWPIL